MNLEVPNPMAIKIPAFQPFWAEEAIMKAISGPGIRYTVIRANRKGNRKLQLNMHNLFFEGILLLRISESMRNGLALSMQFS